ncbi:hypothetical protein [Mycobacterium sp.]|uniref:hypothetical protein n=1 Tax=Mycobacterium sp. TaxID=1785 RepID=UPI003C778975
MDEENRNVKVAAGLDRDADRNEQVAATDDAKRTKRLRFWANWALALLTVVGAGIVMVYFFGAVLSTAACSQQQCQHVGPTWMSPDVSFYGAPAVAVVTVIVSFFTAHRRWGIVVPLLALALLAADITILAVTVAQ